MSEVSGDLAISEYLLTEAVLLPADLLCRTASHLGSLRVHNFRADFPHCPGKVLEE